MSSINAMWQRLKRLQQTQASNESAHLKPFKLILYNPDSMEVTYETPDEELVPLRSGEGRVVCALPEVDEDSTGRVVFLDPDVEEDDIDLVMPVPDGYKGGTCQQA